ncbi:MAG: ROK family protein [Clostridiales bacterium]|nr:ROK family protein [Clostridiales bacterium]
MYIGIDLGGTNIAAGLVDESGRIIVQGSTPTISSRPAEEIVADMAKLSLQLIKDAGKSVDEITAVGIGCPGTIDQENGVVVYANNLKMDRFEMAKEMRKYIDLPVYIENDANCAALGEYEINGENAGVFVLITLGTGVGAGLVIDGKLFRGFNGAAPELGHMTLVSGGEMCTCGKAGCWESYASVTALIRQTRQAMEKHPESLMNKLAQENGKVSGRTAFEAAKAGDAAAEEVVKQYAEYVADGIVSVENAFQPRIISVGGGISKEGDYLMNPIKEFVERTRYNRYMPKTKLVTAKLFNDAGIIGAAMNARNSVK